jgi:enoyl-CoA hydratase/carnithine racemase
MVMTHKEIAVEFRGEAEQVAVIRLMRAAKRNALSDGLVLGLRDVFMNLPASVRAAVVMAMARISAPAWT